jgi:hypothetical protein
MGQSQPKTTTVNPYLIQQIYKPRDFRALADQINRYREETFSRMSDLDRMSGGNPAEIGAQTAKTFKNAAAAYQSSIPQADKYIRAVTGQEDPYAVARESAQSNLDLTKSLSAEAEKEAASYQAPAYTKEKFSWEDLPTPGGGKNKQNTRKAGQALTKPGGFE